MRSKVPEPADDALLKKKLPPTVVKFTISPAVELLLKINRPATNDCITPEPLMMPVP